MKKDQLLNATLETFQWFIFLLASTVAMPIVIGSIFEMNAVEIAGLMQRTIFVVGLASLLQAIFGHRLPIVEGPAGIWISIFSVMAITGVQNGSSLQATLRTLESMMIVTGIILFLFGAFKLSEKFLYIFTPLVTGTFFLLLTVQLSGTFLKGMLGLQSGSNTIHSGEATLAFLTFFIVLGLSIFVKTRIKNYAVLIGIVIGWILHFIFIGVNKSYENTKMFSIPEVFAFGMPRFDVSTIPIAFLIAILLISNLVASVVSMQQVITKQSTENETKINRGTALSGINHLLAGIFSAIGNVPLTTTTGFVAITRQKRKQPFIFATLFLIAMIFFPPIVTFFSSIPASIANAALMATFIQLVGLAFNNITMKPLDSRRMTIVGIAYLVGMGTMFLPPEVFTTLPMIAQNILSNGLLVGTAIVIILEQVWKEK